MTCNTLPFLPILPFRVVTAHSKEKREKGGEKRRKGGNGGCCA